ncbi:metallophosphoesterase family protein [Xenorhabdus hominickii]|uniref:Calcineurin-like phosphoesterase superfamily domain protein n=1 Tax=Xenorhabdus hominickii TaxID=351679 RepID=A0A1V0M428_XENHO|nr:metallophosphoesterase [Xenorhabdus hominickii]ARD69622.1 Calcineurin-like phosphoesterase superfamily domain protein [Xenorhabdus hominickii]PHM52336.1 exonuclease [Xenorhabdus hominickii]
MKKALYGLISDTHYHTWDAFASTAHDGMNSRLKIQLDATWEAAVAAKEAGAKALFHAGDVFHVRGSIAPTVLHFTSELYNKIINMLELPIYILAGNHDLETNDSVFSANASASFTKIGAEIVCSKTPKTFLIDDVRIHMISWYSDHKALLNTVKELAKTLDLTVPNDLIIHTSINKSIPGMPDVGMEAEEFEALGFRYVLSGHYHNHKEVIPGVISIGALTHQNWGDVGTTAGYMLVNEDGSYSQNSTKAPVFLELNSDLTEDMVKGNYVRIRAVIKDDEEGKKLEEMAKLLGAGGVSRNFTKESSLVGATAATASTAKIDSLKESVGNYCVLMGKSDPEIDISKLTATCEDVLSQAEGKE